VIVRPWARSEAPNVSAFVSPSTVMRSAGAPSEQSGRRFDHREKLAAQKNLAPLAKAKRRGHGVDVQVHLNWSLHSRGGLRASPHGRGEGPRGCPS
jgi:hypothetical protein